MKRTNLIIGTMKQRLTHLISSNGQAANKKSTRKVAKKCPLIW